MGASQQILASYGGAATGIELVASAGKTETASLTVACPKPTGTADGDLMLAFVASGTTNTWTAPAGWTEALDSTGRAFYYKIASSEGTSYTFTQSGSSYGRAAIATYRNAAFDVVGTLSGSADPVVAPSITVSEDSSIVIFCTSYLAGTGSFVVPAGFTELASSTTRPTMAVLSAPYNAGATGDVTSDAPAASRAYLVSIKPA